jgi:hypothetical protein
MGRSQPLAVASDVRRSMGSGNIVGTRSDL